MANLFLHEAKLNHSQHHDEAEGVIDCDELFFPGTLSLLWFFFPGPVSRQERSGECGQKKKKSLY